MKVQRDEPRPPLPPRAVDGRFSKVDHLDGARQRMDAIREQRTRAVLGDHPLAWRREAKEEE